MIGYWSFDFADGGVVPDLSGEGHDGQLTPPTPLAPGGKSGQALASPMTVESLSGKSFPSHGTLSFWLDSVQSTGTDPNPPLFQPVSTNGDVTDSHANGVDLLVYNGETLPAMPEPATILLLPAAFLAGIIFVKRQR